MEKCFPESDRKTFVSKTATAFFPANNRKIFSGERPENIHEQNEWMGIEFHKRNAKGTGTEISREHTGKKKVKKGGGETQESHSLLQVLRKIFVMVKLHLLRHFDLEMR